MGGTFWNLHILVTVSYVSPLAKPIVVVGVYLDTWHLALNLL